jgi:8-oxo-dGTP pyrophosphatase MutT (NUDIX family)
MAAPDPKRLRRTAACAIVLDDRGRVLLHRRTDNGRWALPGGAIETGETAHEAVVREVREETGFAVEVLRLVGVYSDPRHTTIAYPDGNVIAYVAVAFECRLVGGSPALSDETSAVEWFDPDARALLRDAIGARLDPARSICDPVSRTQAVRKINPRR